MKLINDLATQNLTPEEKSLVDGLKQQAQKLAEAAAVKQAGDEANQAVGGLLKPKN